MKQLKKRNNQSQRNLRKSFSPFKEFLPHSWRRLIMLSIFGLVIVTVLIPSLITAPFFKGGDPSALDHEAPYSIEEIPSDVMVSVLRMKSDEIEDVPLETYVTRVLASEMPAEFEMEALKAQAVVARTYIVSHLLHKQETEISDTTDHQVYRNEQELRELWGEDFHYKMERLTKAVAATKGKILTYKQLPITAAYFSTSNGYTENSEDYWENDIPYLRSVESPWDEDSPKYLDQKILPLQEVSEILEIPLQSHSNISIKMDRTESGRVKQLRINDHSFSGREIREKLQLNSNDFTIEQKDDHFVFTTRGFGHGVGMSQYGANGMAKEGKNYQEIVHHYYQDIEIHDIEEIAPELISKEEL